MSAHYPTSDTRVGEDDFVSIIMPVRNEASYIVPSLQAVLAQDYPADAFEVIIADGMSDDGTREKILELAGRDTRVRLIDNPQRFVSPGLNAALRAARGDILIRMDAHTEYAPDYVRQCVEVLQETGAANVGGAWRATGRSYWQKAIALAFQSPFSSGGAGSHAVDYEGEVDAVYLGCWRKATLEQIGGFDEELVRNQDDELSLRLMRAGAKLWQSPRIRSWYYPRASLRALFNQYAQYGYWKVRVIQKHKLPASIRHLVPGSFVASLIILTGLSCFSHTARWFLVGLVSCYVVANLGASLLTCRTPAIFRYLPVMPLIFAAYHFGYGYGFLRGLVDFSLWCKGGSSTFSQLTRPQKNEAEHGD
ncbi:MAG: glycosyltransferase family 2 protein [Ktedonobacteraceae bacterium]|jgi:succinoglycan biosynthesis protein ExoA